MVKLTDRISIVRGQRVILDSDPYVFTEHGAVMAAGVLNSPRAIDASIFIIRAVVELPGGWQL